MISQLHIQNYKALRDVTLDLTPMHVLIGPNDSGKTSILEAVAALCRSVDHELPQAFTGSWEGADLVWQGATGQNVMLSAAAGTGGSEFLYQLWIHFGANGRRAQVVLETFQSSAGPTPTLHNKEKREWTMVFGYTSGITGTLQPEQDVARAVADQLAGSRSYRWDPRLLALPVAADAKRILRIESDGFGLAMCLDDMLGQSRQKFDSLEKRFVEEFPLFESIRLRRMEGYSGPVDDPERVPKLTKAAGKGIEFKLKGSSQVIPATQVSDGVLIVLAYLTLMHLPEPPQYLLIEEPENGVHPKRLKEIIGFLRKMTEEHGCQVIMTTHSPYVLDEFKPEEVTMCRMEDDGAVSTMSLSKSKKVREQIDVFTLGEIWTGEGEDSLAEETSEEPEPAS